MKIFTYALATTFVTSLLTISALNAGVVTVSTDFRTNAAVAGGVNTGGLRLDPSGTTVEGGLLYANGSDVLNLQLTIDDTADTGAVFTAILTISGVRENPEGLPTAPDGILVPSTGGQILINGSVVGDMVRNGDQVALSIGSFVQVSGPPAEINFDGYTRVVNDQFNTGAAGSKSFSFGSVSFANTGGGTSAPVPVDITGATGDAGEIFDGTGTGRFRWRILDATFTVTSSASPVLLGDIDLNGTVEFLDISPFIDVLASGNFQAEADCNESGDVNFLDISPFIQILSGAITP